MQLSLSEFLAVLDGGSIFENLAWTMHTYTREEITVTLKKLWDIYGTIVFISKQRFELHCYSVIHLRFIKKM